MVRLLGGETPIENKVSSLHVHISHLEAPSDSIVSTDVRLTLLVARLTYSLH